MGASIREASCFEREEPNCLAPPMKCKPYNYVNSEHGVLITTSGKVFGSPIDVGQLSPEKKYLVALNTSSLNTIYVSWSNFSSIKILLESNEYMIRVIEPPESSWNRFVETIDFEEDLGTNLSEKSHLKALSGIVLENINLHNELKKELTIVNNISTNPEDYEKKVKNSSVLSYIATALSSAVVLLVLVKNFQCAAAYASCFNDCGGGDRLNNDAVLV